MFGLLTLILETTIHLFKL